VNRKDLFDIAAFAPGSTMHWAVQVDQLLRKILPMAGLECNGPLCCVE
jgi:hypothetical protein